MKHSIDKGFEIGEKGRPQPLPGSNRCPRRGLTVVGSKAPGGRVLAAFEVERLGKIRRFAFTVDDLLGLVLRDYQVANKRSLRTVKYPLGHVQAFFGKEKLARDVTAEDVENYVISRRQGAHPAAEATIKVELAMLKRGFALAVRLRRGLTANDVPPFPVIAADKLTVRHGFLRSDQVHRVMSYLDGDLSDLVEFLFATGWRFGEAQGLKWSNVEEDRIWIATSKSGHPRSIPIAGDELVAVMQRRVRRRNGDFVFHREGQKVTSCRWQWKRACSRAGYADRGWVIHDLRRSAITRMMAAGSDQKTAMEWSGHRTDAVFRRYLIVTMERMAEVAEKVTALERELPFKREKRQ